MTASDH